MKWTEWVTCARDHAPAEMPAGARHALLLLATYADENGRCYPSIRRLAVLMGVSKSTAQRRVAVIVTWSWLTVEHEGRFVGDPNRYRITPHGCAHATGKRPASGTARGLGTVPNKAPNRPAGATRTFQNVPERADSAPFMETALAAPTGELLATPGAVAVPDAPIPSKCYGCWESLDPSEAVKVDAGWVHRRHLPGGAAA